MPSRFVRLGVALATVMAIIALAFLPAPANATPKEAKPVAAPGKTGEMWQVTSQIAMEGMPMRMPAQTHQVCAPKNWKEPPGAQNPEQNCQISDLQSTTSKTTWKMKCTGPDMTGTGEITRSGPDAYTGAIKMTSAEGSVTINLTGKRTGECDYQDTAMTPAQSAAANAKLDADLERMRADGCKGVAQSLQLQILKLDSGGCNDAATKEIYCDTVYSAQGTQELIKRGNAIPGEGLKDAFDFCGNAKGKSAYCGQFNTPAGYTQFASSPAGPGSPQETIATYCGLSAAQMEENRKKICKAITPATEPVFLAKYCPDEAKPIAEKECAGRNFTGAAPTPYGQFCQAYAMQAAAAPAGQPAEAEDTKGKKTKKFLKGLWPH